MNVSLMRTCFFIIQFLVFVGLGNATVQAAGIDARVPQELNATGHAKVILALNLPEPNRLRMARATLIRDPIGNAQEAVLSSLPAGSYELAYQYSHVPGLAMTVTPESFAILKDHPQVKYIQFDELEHIALAQAVPLIHANDVWALNPPSGITGSGVTVAVLDSGINTAHSDFADFAGKIIAQKCFLKNDTGNKCPPSGTDPGGDTGISAEDDQGHGSHVSGIVAANGTHTGVAKGANIAAVKVCNNKLQGGCLVSDGIAGLNWLLADDNSMDSYATNYDAYGIKIVNMSIASSELYSDSCDVEDATRKAAVDSLVNAGITVFAAAGNTGNQPGGKSKIAAPACLSNTIAVGATYDAIYSPTPTKLVCEQEVTNADTVACFSNSSLWLDILAPGSEITSSWIGTTTATQVEAGTSMATPMASGVAALMLQKNPALTPAQIKAKLKKTGVSVIDTATGANNIARPRIDALAAVNDASTAQPIIEVSTVDGKRLLDQSEIDFGYTAVGDGLTRVINIKNIGTVPLNLTFPNIPVGFSIGPTMTISAGVQQTLQIKLDAVVANSYAGVLQLTDNLAGSFKLNLKGTVCTLRTIPFSEGFESGVVPSCWRVVNNNDAINWGILSSSSAIFTQISGNYVAGIEGSSSVDNDDWLILPKITLGNNSKFQFKAIGKAGTAQFDVKLSNTGNNINNFNILLSPASGATGKVTPTGTVTDTAIDTTITNYYYLLGGYVGQNVYLAIHSYNPNYGGTLIVDDVSVTDTLAPNYYQNSPPKTGNLTTTGFDLTARLDETGKAYYVVLLASNSNVPINTQVKNGQDSTGTTTNVKASGFIDVTAANSDFSKTISGLTSGTAYKIYVVSEDVSSNLQTAVTSVNATTTVIPPPVTPTPAPPSYTVVEHKDGTGTGRITSIYIGQSTWTSMAALSAIPDPDSVFVKWTGNTFSQDCYGDQPTIYVKLNAIKTCTATFDKITADNQSLVPVKLAAYYLPGIENSGKAWIRITNTNPISVTVKGTLYHASGQLLGIANSVLIPTLAPQATVELSTTDLAKLSSAPAWTGLAWLHITTPNGLKMLNLLENDNKILSNFSTLAQDNVLYNLPASTSTEQANVVLINTGDTLQTVTATLYADTGQILGKTDAILADVAARGIVIISMPQLESLVGTTAWTGHVAKLRVTAATNIKLMTTLLSENATITNLTPTHDNAVFNLPGTTNLDQAFVYISNTTDTAMSVQATLYHQDGYVLGSPNTVIINQLAPQATQLLSVSDVENLFKVPTWQKRARLMITAPTAGIKVMVLIRNDSGVSNLSAMTSNEVPYLPDVLDADKAYIRIANTHDIPVTVTGIVYAETGQILGSGVIAPALAAQTITVISVPVLQEMLKIPGWQGKARLVLNPSDLQVMNTLRSNAGQLLDMSDIAQE